MSDRRTELERRRLQNRRRGDRRTGEQRVFVVEIAQDAIHAAVHLRTEAEGSERIEAVTAPWRREATELATPLGVAELAAALRDAAKQLGAAGSAVHIVLASEYCVIRAVRGSAEQVRGELKHLEQRSRLYLSLGPGPKAVVHHAVEIDARRQYALSLIANQAVLDAIQEAADSANLMLAGVEAALTCVNRALPRLGELADAPVLFVHARAGVATIAVFHRGRLLLDYRPGARLSAEEITERLVTHRNRLQRHAARQGDTAEELAEVLVEGSSAELEKLASGLIWQGAFRVRQAEAIRVAGPWRIARGAEESLTLAVLGGVIGRLAPEATRDAPDLLEHILERTRVPLRPILVRSALPLAGVVLAAAALAGFNLRYERRAAALERQTVELAPAVQHARELQLQLLRSREKLVHLEALAKQLNGRTGGDLVRRLGGCLPNDVWLERLEMTDARTIALRGASFLEAGVYDFVRWLEEAPDVEETALKGTSPGSSAAGPLTNFDVELTLVASAATAAGGGSAP